MEATKEIVIGNFRYQISRVDAETGSWLLFQVLSAMREAMQGQTEEDQFETQQQPQAKLSPEEEKKQIENSAMGMIQQLLMTVDKDSFSRIQRYALSACGQYTAVGETETICPVLMANGRIAIPDLKHDIQALVALTSQSLHFNLLPFFSNGGFKSVMT